MEEIDGEEVHAQLKMMHLLVHTARLTSRHKELEMRSCRVCVTGMYSAATVNRPDLSPYKAYRSESKLKGQHGVGTECFTAALHSSPICILLFLVYYCVSLLYDMDTRPAAPLSESVHCYVLDETQTQKNCGGN